jgi:hypothetical protein
MLTLFRCALHRFFRRTSWGILFLIGALSYPAQLDLMVRYVTRGVPAADLLAMRAAAYGKLVEPLLFYSKISISIGIFCLVNLLGWAALMVVPVLIHWATGRYKEENTEFPVRRGFKGTFLIGLTDGQRMAVFVGVWALELLVAVASVQAGFTIQ